MLRVSLLDAFWIFFQGFQKSAIEKERGPFEMFCFFKKVGSIQHVVHGNKNLFFLYFRPMRWVAHVIALSDVFHCSRFLVIFETTS